MKIRRVVSELLHKYVRCMRTDGWMDGLAEATQLIVGFRNLPKRLISFGLCEAFSNVSLA
jgi:hypothetical protein